MINNNVMYYFTHDNFIFIFYVEHVNILSIIPLFLYNKDIKNVNCNIINGNF